MLDTYQLHIIYNKYYINLIDFFYFCSNYSYIKDWYAK